MIEDKPSPVLGFVIFTVTVNHVKAADWWIAMTPAKECPDFCKCNRDWVFRHTSYTEDGHAIGGKIICYTCGRKTLFDVSFREPSRIIWRHESFGNGTWPIPDDAWVELEKIHAQRNEH